MTRSISIIVLLCLAFACSSGKKAYEQGNYEEAVLTAINRLRQNPNGNKARETLASAYPLFLDYQQDRIRQFQLSGDPLRWEGVAQYYERINALYNEIKRSPAASQVVSAPALYLRELEEARLKAAEARFALGERALEQGRKGDREAAKQAYEHFVRADEFSPGFRNSAQLAETARRLAIVVVEVAPIPIASRSLEISNEFFYNQLLEQLRGTQISPFVEFYTREELAVRNQQPNQRVILAFDEFVVGQAFIKETVQDRQRDSVVIGTVEVVEEGKKVNKDVYGTVKAKVHLFQKEINSRGLLDCRIVNTGSAAVVAQEKFPGSFSWIDYWGFFNGDERALIAEDKRRLSNRSEVAAPPPQQLFVEFTKPIFRDLTRFLTSTYANY